jgi:D-alanine-D-alanine ligase
MKPTQNQTGVVVLYNASDNLIKGEPRDLLAEQGVIACAQAVAHALQEVGYQVAEVPIHTDVESALAAYPPAQWMIFNLGEGLEGRLFEEARIAWALEAMGYCFTGSDGEAIARSVHKVQAKRLLAAAGVATPPGWMFRHPDDVDALAVSPTYPLIVKPVAEDASIGVGPDAVVHTRQALRDRVAYVIECYRQAALVEAFIDGREFNISLWGDPPRVLPLAEVDFGAFVDPYARIVSFAAKWEQDSFEYNHTPVRCPASVDRRLSRRITTTAQRAWTAIGCRGYTRVDMRVDDGRVPYVVEVNCNPDLSPDAGFYRAAQATGYSYRNMVIRILRIARRQYDVRNRAGFKRRWPIYPGNNGARWCLYSDGVDLRGGALERLPG